MIKRALAALAVTGVAFAIPVAASASTDYPVPPPELTCSSAQAAPGSDFTCTLTGDPSAEATLTTTFSGADAAIAGTVTSAPRLVGATGAVFTITAPVIEGTIGISAVVGQASAGTASVDVALAVADDGLSGTGFTGMPIAVGAGVFLVAGAAMVFVASRRRSDVNA